MTTNRMIKLDMQLLAAVMYCLWLLEIGMVRTCLLDRAPISRRTRACKHS